MKLSLSVALIFTFVVSSNAISCWVCNPSQGGECTGLFDNGNFQDFGPAYTSCSTKVYYSFAGFTDDEYYREATVYQPANGFECTNTGLEVSYLLTNFHNS